MKKIRLNLDCLDVMSFDTVQYVDPSAGTVRAHDSNPTDQPWCSPSGYCEKTDWLWASCGHSCLDRCVDTEWIYTCTG